MLLAFLEWQGDVLPIPEDAGQLEAMLRSLSPLALVALIGLSPGLCEELLFRGAILWRLRKDLSPLRVVAWQALLFGAVHASLHRFAPTALVGAALAALTLRSGRLWPAVVLHATYNSLAVLGVHEKDWWHPGVALGLGAAGLLLLAIRR